MAIDDEAVGSGTLSPRPEPGNSTGVAPIARLWPRVLAFLIDSILLGIVGQVLGWSLSSVWFELGPYGRTVGAVIAACYFAVMGSRIGGGSTLGKRLLRLSVRRGNGQPIGIARSLLRTSVWLVPATLNGWALPILANPVLSRVTLFLVFGFGGAFVVTMIFNRRTRQGLHDLVAQTYVLRVSEPAVEAVPSPGRLPWILSGTMLTFALLLASVGGQLMKRALPQLEDLMTLQQRLQKDARFFSASVFDNTFYGSNGTKSRMLRIQVWYKGVPAEPERAKVMNEVARVTLATGNRNKFDLIRIEVLSAYDLGIASGSVNHADAQPVSVWKQRLARANHPSTP